VLLKTLSMLQAIWIALEPDSAPQFL